MRILSHVLAQRTVFGTSNPFAATMLQQGSLSVHTMALAHLRAKSRNDQRTSMPSASSRSLAIYDKTDFSCCHPPSDRDLRFPKAGASVRENHVANQRRRHRNAIVAFPTNYFYRPVNNASCLPNRLPERHVHLYRIKR